MENIYYDTLIKKNVVVEPKYLTPQIDEYILKVLQKKYEGKCIHEGYVKEDSIVIEKKSAGLLYGSHFTGEITYTILFKAEVCNPVAGNVIEFEVQSKNQMCLRGVLGPMEIVIPREMVFDNPVELKLLDSYKIGDKIKAEVIKSRYFPNSTNIRVIAKVISSENNRNKNNKANNKTFVSSETNIDDEEMPNAILQNINVEEASDEESVSSDEESASEAEEDESEEESMGEDIELSDSDNEQFNDDVEGVKDVVMKNPNEENVSDEEEEENYEEDVEDEETSDNEGGDDEY